MAKKLAYQELEQLVEEKTSELVWKIEERKQAEEILHESEEKYRSLVESTEDSIYLVDRDGTYLFVNEKHLSRLGSPVDKVIGRTYGEVHSLYDTKEFVGKIEEVFETGQATQHEHRSLRDDRYFLRTLSPVKDPDGNKHL
ncbi:MAG: PAS domain-containing protein [Proteobacteria bacterium]|nr:PAS domain-containing protein [Pseudomonadota bacterium]